MKRTKLRLLLALTACAGGVFGALQSADAAAPLEAYTTKDSLSFISAPGLHPAHITTTGPVGASKLARGDFMLSTFKNLALTEPLDGQGGPMILNSKLQVLWFRPGPAYAFDLNLTTQTFNAKPALSWWQGVISNVGTVISGEDIVVDQHYRTVATLQGADGWLLTPHEFLISGHDAWVTANKNVPMDLTAEGGAADGVLTDSAVQEYDLNTGKLLYTWSALAHIPLSDSNTHPAPGIPWDAYHINAIDLVGSNEFITSMRNTSAGYLVNATTSDIVWTLGGKQSSFTFGPGATFSWQHNIELHSNGEVSLFDDACCAVVGGGRFAPPDGPSRGLVLKLDTATHTATLVAQYVHKPTLETATQGDAIPLAGGNVIVGWGGLPYFTEYSNSGKVLLDAIFPGPDVSYRAYVQQWVGTPGGSPSGAARTQGRKTTVYASWNGATQIAGWEVLGGKSSRKLVEVAHGAWSGFETRISLKQSYRVLRVVALDSHGHVLGRSKAFGSP
jgi:hypothetical protein